MLCLSVLISWGQGKGGFSCFVSANLRKASVNTTGILFTYCSLVALINFLSYLFFYLLQYSSCCLYNTSRFISTHTHMHTLQLLISPTLKSMSDKTQLAFPTSIFLTVYVHCINNDSLFLFSGARETNSESMHVRSSAQSAVNSYC